MLHWIPVLLYAGVIFYISSQPYIGLPNEVVLLDPHNTFLHVLEYVPLGFLTARAVSKTHQIQDGNSGFFPTLLGVAYGLSDEVHQYFVPGRTASVFDLAADSTGVLIGVFLWVLMHEQGIRKRMINNKSGLMDSTNFKK